ncbi:MAG: sulfatase [Verrucomicrobia bacterium]|mgnify:CR=1 FL=1|nr:sulfatase [Verrucomicrobiota bacterium]
MGKIHFFFGLWLLLIGLCSAVEDRVNFVFIVTDDLGIRDLGCYGSDYYETPHLDQLASEGIRFTKAYASASVCSPTRASILTGHYPHRVQLTDALPWDRLYKNPKMVPPDHLKELPSSIATYPQVFRKAGYRTALIGKWHLGNEHEFFQKKKHLDYGFDEAFDRNGKDKGVEALTAKSIAFIKKNKEKAFFLTLMHHTPHVPLTCPPEYKARFAKKKPGRFQKNPTYAGMISHLDDSMGKIFSTLESLGLAKKTVVVFCSDNGGLQKITSNRPYRGAKGNLYEGGILVPLILRWPDKVAAGTSTDVKVLSSDFFPTFLELAGLDLQPKSHQDGLSFASILTGKSMPSRPLFWHFPHRGTPSSAIIKGDWKLIHFIETESYELYNLKKDPSERKDLFESQQQKSLQLIALLKEHLQETNSQMMHPNPSWEKSDLKGKAENFGIFYPGNGKSWQPVTKSYPSWFKHRE